MFEITRRDGLAVRLAGLLLLTCLSVLAIISRRPDAVFQAQFWAEDGKYWYLQAHEFGYWRPLLMQQNGYLQTVSRLIGALAQGVPLVRAPLLFNCCAIAFQILPVLLLYTARGRAQVPGFALRLLLSVLYLGHPYSAEVHANVTNIQWHLVLAATMILAFPASSLRWMAWFDGLLLVLASLSGPFSVFLAPISLLLAWFRQDRRSLGLAAIVLGCGLIQAGILAMHHGQGDRFTTGLGASPALLIKLFASKVILAGLPGAKLGLLRWLAASPYLWPATLIAAVGGTVLILGLVQGTALARAVIGLGMMVFVGSLILPQISARIPQWQAYLLPAAGGRYAFIPVLAFYVAVLVLVVHGGRQRLLGVAILLAVLVMGVLANWRMGAYPDLHFPRYAQLYARAAPGREVDIPIYPGPYWTLKLLKP